MRETARQSGPFSSISVDASRAGESAAGGIPVRLRALGERLADRGAPSADIDVLRDTGASLPGRGGPLTRLMVARGGEIVLDLVMPGAPPRDECTFGPAPHLLPAARSVRLSAPYLVLDVDRAGADIEVVDELGATADAEQVQGSHELLHKVPSGGWSHRRMQARVQDSWDRNAAEVAAEVDRIVAEVAPAVVLVDGDPYAVGALTRALGGAAGDLVVRLKSGGRAAGIDQQARRNAIGAALAEHEKRTRHALVDRFSAAEARQQEAVQGLSAVVDALRRSQVDTVLLHHDPTSTATLWSGAAPLQIGTERAELADMGVEDPVAMRADAILARAVYASGADLTLLGEQDLDLADGIGAVLRWSDRSTPHDAVPAMPGHGQQPGTGTAPD